MSEVTNLNIRIGADISNAEAGFNKVQQSLASTAVSAQKTDSSLDKLATTFSKISNANTTVAKSFDEVSAEVFSAADAFNAKWNPVVAAAAAEATQGTVKINLLADAVKRFGGGVMTYQNPIKSVGESITAIKKPTVDATQAFTNLGRVVQDAPYGFIGISNNLNPLLEGFQRLSAQAKTAGVSIGSTLLSALKGPGGIGLALSAVTAIVTFASIGFRAWGATAKSSAGELDAAAESAKKFNDAVKSINDNAATELTKVKELISGFSQENVSRRDKIGIINQLKQINPQYFGQLDAEKTSVGQLKTAYDNYNNAVISSIKTKVFSKQLEDLVKQELDLRQAIENNNKLLLLRKGFNLKDQGGTDPGIEVLQRAGRAIDTDINQNLAAQQKLLDKINGLGGIDAIFNFSDTKAAKTKENLYEVFAALRGLNFESTLFKVFENPLKIGDQLKPVQRILDKGPGFVVPLNFGSDEELKKKAETISGIITDTLSDAFSRLGEDLGSGKNIFAGIFEVLGEGLKTLGKYLIVASKLIGAVREAINNALTKPGGQIAGIALGIGLIALGALIEKNLPKMAAGGIVTRPTNALIGESGPEAVIPLGQFQGLRANDGGGGVVEFVIHGQVLRGILKRADQSASRLQ